MAAKDIVSCKVRMYTMGTGDCFILSFYNDEDNEKPVYKLMIDCGAYKISEERMKPFAEDIISHTNGFVNALLVTHEHEDHVLGFERAEEMFTEKFATNELWLPWTENTSDPMVASWKTEYGKKKKTLAKAAALLSNAVNSTDFEKYYSNMPASDEKIQIRKNIAEAVSNHAELNGIPLAGDYIGSLKGLEVATTKIKANAVKYLEPGMVMENLGGLSNIRIYVLGPPRVWKAVKTTEGSGDEVYKHNNAIESIRGLSSFPFEEDDLEAKPFDNKHILQKGVEKPVRPNNIIESYINGEQNRRIDTDWLMSAGNLALRLTRGINNLSAVIAIEFIKSGKVMLFPGDAEIGSWQSWHDIKWSRKGKDNQTHLTTDLLNRTVFYKVAHHLSSNGTAKKEGIALMPNSGMTAMATLDYDAISSVWKGTMPNRELLKDLISATDGRLFVMNMKDLYLGDNQTKPLEREISKIRNSWPEEQKEKFKNDFTHKEGLYLEYHLDGS